MFYVCRQLHRQARSPAVHGTWCVQPVQLIVTQVHPDQLVKLSQAEKQAGYVIVPQLQLQGVQAGQQTKVFRKLSQVKIVETEHLQG